MAGFYGRISNTNKSAFTFDITYPSRVVMDERAQDDGVFIGRYVEVEYDDPPLTGYKDGGNTGYWEKLKVYNKATIDGTLQVLPGLQRRRIEEYELFTEGDYNYDAFSQAKIDKYY